MMLRMHWCCDRIDCIVLQVELVCRVATVLLQTHHNQLVTTPAARPVVTVLKDILYARVKVVTGFSFVH